MKKKELTLLVGKYVKGLASPEERAFVEAWYREAGSSLPIDNVLTPSEVQQLEVRIFDNIQARIRNVPATLPVGPPAHVPGGTLAARRIPMYRKALAVAASLLFLTFASYFAWQHFSDREITYSTIYTQPGKVQKLQLGDGTIAWLNADSRLKFPENFNGRGPREIFLQGEAYFEVAKDEKRPFLVHTKGLTTRVLGTRFNVKAYPESSKGIEVTLLEGKVMLTAPAADPTAKKEDTLFLTPNQKAYYTGHTIHLQKDMEQVAQTRPDSEKRIAGRGRDETVPTLLKETVTDAHLSVSWRDGELVFHREPLENVMGALSRKYDIRIQADSSLLAEPVTIIVNTPSPEEALLEVTRQLKRRYRKGHAQPGDKVQFRREGNVYFIE